MPMMKRKNQSPAVDHLAVRQPREPSGSSKDWFDQKTISENMPCSPTAEQEPLCAELRSYNFLELVVRDWLAQKKVSEERTPENMDAWLLNTFFSTFHQNQLAL